ncbi:carboxypeptidase-like regulatory domain-containing protein [Lewinella sp. 4G2]|uniref:carboxypeptidase-like regulatory domain-containing protein n=1 Tax=Lewinella sp. 4G2 TaxID=1803372 RepID=UPI0007B46B8C|nr:carboxypeptidase-like regulatory domain-containing protein [Lewinella sp. 4G2]OAV43108.1 hypothetical protein A3850_000735 [Lewinella sp. 4G2]
MQHLLPTLLILFSLSSLSAQTILRGTVKDGATQEPVPFATVYIDGTTIGTNTDNDGAFSLDVSKVSLPANLVVTHLNYQRFVTEVKTTDRPYALLLAPQAAIAAVIEVGDDRQREKNIEEFTKRFLGVDAWGKAASITDTDPLYFERNFERQEIAKITRQTADMLMNKELRDAKWNAAGDAVSFDSPVDFTARSTSPLKLDLPHTGYTVFVDLQQFYLHYAQGLRNYYGTFYFVPAEAEGQAPKRRHWRNRKLAYYNSRQHFLRSLFADDLDAQGFVTLIREEDDRIDTLDLPYYLEGTTDKETTLTNLEECDITILYYPRTDGSPAAPDQRRNRTPVSSSLFVRDSEIVIRRDGTTGPAQLYFGGRMGSRAAAWLLPADYQPPQK